jgi:hypothetical protein
MKCERLDRFDYFIRIDGTVRPIYDSPPPNRGDMAFYGFSLFDIQPPIGYTVKLDANMEPAFILEPSAF